MADEILATHYRATGEFGSGLCFDVDAYKIFRIHCSNIVLPPTEPFRDAALRQEFAVGMSLVVQALLKMDMDACMMRDCGLPCIFRAYIAHIKGRIATAGSVQGQKDVFDAATAEMQRLLAAFAKSLKSGMVKSTYACVNEQTIGHLIDEATRWLGQYRDSIISS